MLPKKADERAEKSKEHKSRRGQRAVGKPRARRQTSTGTPIGPRAKKDDSCKTGVRSTRRCEREQRWAENRFEKFSEYFLPKIRNKQGKIDACRQWTQFYQHALSIESLQDPVGYAEYVRRLRDPESVYHALGYDGILKSTRIWCDRDPVQLINDLSGPDSRVRFTDPRRIPDPSPSTTRKKKGRGGYVPIMKRTAHPVDGWTSRGPRDFSKVSISNRERNQRSLETNAYIAAGKDEETRARRAAVYRGARKGATDRTKS